MDTSPNFKQNPNVQNVNSGVKVEPYVEHIHTQYPVPQP
jgi:hypothetical protein